MSQQLVTPILAQFDTNIALITSEAVNAQGGGFQASAYRFTPDKEPDSAAEGLYYLDVPSVKPKARYFGTGENIWTGSVTVQLGYYRGGGDAGGSDGGDHRSVMARANDDCMRLSDVCENPANYNSPATGIRWIRYNGHRRSYSLKKYEIWEVAFDVEWRSDLADAGTGTSTSDDVAILTIAGEYGSTSSGSEDVVTQPLYFDFDDVSWATVACRLMGAAKVTAGTGTLRVRLGGTIGMSDGTLIAQGTVTSSSYSTIGALGTSFVNPGGEKLIQVTIANDTNGATSYFNGITIGLRRAT